MQGTSEHKKVKLNLARLKRQGETFEVVVNPDPALAFRRGGDIDIREALRDLHVYSDAGKGMRVGEQELERIFNTTDHLTAALVILKEGELQLTTEQREAFREEKLKQLVSLISKMGIDPRTGAPHPATRIANAIDKAKVHIDEHRSAQDQLGDVVKTLRQIIPISIARKTIELIIPAQYGQKSYGTIKRLSTIKKESWDSDGSLRITIEIPGGLELDLYDTVNKITHGQNQSRVLSTTSL